MKADPRIVIYAQGHRPPDIHRRSYVPVFFHDHLAKAWLLHFMGNRPIEIENGQIKVSGDFDITLRSDDFDRIMAAPPSNHPLPKDELELIGRFKFGTWDELPEKEPEPIIDSADDNPAAPKIKAPKPERAAKAQRPPGYVSIGDLAVTWNMPAMNARALLRASGLTKPEFGWAFDPKEVPKIKKLLGIK